MIRVVLFFLTACVLVAAVCRAEDADDLFSGAVDVRNGRVQILLCGTGDKAWLNGVPIVIHSAQDEAVELKPGDTIVHAAGRLFWCKKPIEARTFESYHFDRIEKGVAWFTQKSFSVKTLSYEREGARIYPDKLLSTCIRRVISRAASDGGPGEFPGVQLHSPDETQHSKSTWNAVKAVP